MIQRAIVLAAVWSSLVFTCVASAQQPPDMGYMFPPGGQAGTTVDVVLGGYDWTPDMQVFVHDPRVNLEIVGPPSPVIVPEPPYWFGKKARRGPFPLPRETPAKLTIPADMPAGVIRWQAANANGATKAGQFVVGGDKEIVELRNRKTLQKLATLPVTISGQILKIEEVDRYQFTATQSGPITCKIVASAIGSPLTAAVEIHDADGKLIADLADTEGRDAELTFAAQQGQDYTANVYDVDFRGNRAYVYRLSIIPGPRVLAAIPVAGRPGENRAVEFIGFGLTSGSSKLESLTKQVTFPALAGEFQFNVETSFGTVPSIPLLTTDLAEIVESTQTNIASRKLNVPSAVTGILDQRYGADRYVVAGKKGDLWSISVEADRIGSPLDVALTILDAEGKQIRTIDDLPGTTDAALEFPVPADGDYQLLVNDTSGKSGNRAATYRLAIRPAAASYTLSVPELLNVPIGGKGQLAVTAQRYGGFKDPIAISLKGLPAGLGVPEKMEIPAGKNAAKIELTSAADSAALASLVEVTGSAKIAAENVTQTAGKILVAVTLKPPFSINAEGKDDVTKWPRGTTFPAPVLIERDEAFQGEIVLEMAAKQGRHRQGINGPELTVPPNVKRILYPVFLPEWLETTRTSRMVVNGVAKISDPKGNVRHSLSRLKTRIGFLPTGAMLKVSTDVTNVEVQPGQPFDIPVAISRSSELKEAARLELQVDEELQGLFSAEPLSVDANTTEAVLRIVPTEGTLASGERRLTIRATVLQEGHLPVVSETSVLLVFMDDE